MKIEELRELTFLDDWLPHASRIDADSVGLNGETPILHAKRAGDQLAGAEKLADLDDRRAAQRGGQRQMELLERTHPFVTADCRKTLRPESVRDENGGSFAEPDHPRVGAGVLERKDEDAGLDDGAADADGEDVWAETVGASIRSRDESASARRGMSLNRLTTSPPSVP